ncbi:MAG: hypothetical protein L0215_19240 [Gemmataceae bacterium]|nr:hypothetical protein [Gemmataceae bacterium]
MSIQNTTPSPQQRQHWLGEQALAWSGLPVVTIRPTVFLEGFFLPLTSPANHIRRFSSQVPFGTELNSLQPRLAKHFSSSIAAFSALLAQLRVSISWIREIFRVIGSSWFA